MAALSYSELEGLWVSHGGDPSVAPIAAAITFPESGGDPSVVQQGQPYATTGWGLWQITPGNSVPECGVDRALLDPGANACAAVKKWQGSGKSFRPWTTYTGGQYKQYLQAGVAPSAAGSSPTAASSDGGVLGGLGQAVTGAEQSVASTIEGLGLTLLGVLVLAGALWLVVSQTSVGRTAVRALRGASRGVLMDVAGIRV